MPLSANLRRAWLDRSRSAWNDRAADWDAMSEANAVAPDRTADLDRIAAALHLSEGSKILDAGCGSGQWALAFAARGCAVTAVDLSPEMIERARNHAASRNLSVEWRLGDLTAVTDPDATYDAVHARASLQFTPDITAALNEFRRVLRPGGSLLASVPGSLSPIYGRSWRRFIEPDRHAVSYVTPWELELLLEHLGWELLDGWGSYGTDLAGNLATVDAAGAAVLPRRVQQATATLWTIIAR